MSYLCKVTVVNQSNLAETGGLLEKLMHVKVVACSTFRVFTFLVINKFPLIINACLPDDLFFPF